MSNTLRMIVSHIIMWHWLTKMFKRKYFLHVISCPYLQMHLAFHLVRFFLKQHLLSTQSSCAFRFSQIYLPINTYVFFVSANSRFMFLNIRIFWICMYLKLMSRKNWMKLYKRCTCLLLHHKSFWRNSNTYSMWVVKKDQHWMFFSLLFVHVNVRLTKLTN